MKTTTISGALIKDRVMGLLANLLKTKIKTVAGLTICILAASTLAPFVLPIHAADNPQGNMDIVFVIDNSGSMKKNDPQFVTRKAIGKLVEQLPSQSRVGMVLFDEQVQLLHRLRLISNERIKEQFFASLKKIDYKGRYTNSPNGIERALYELKTNGRLDSQKVIVFITDGLVTTGNRSKNRELTQWLKEDLSRELSHLNIQVFGVAFTEAADFSLIQTLASRTQGEYFRASDAAEIPIAFEQIQSRLNTLQSQPSGIEPLPTLPSETAETPENPAPAPAPDKAANDRTPVVVVTPTPWMLYFWMALITIVLIVAVYLFFNKQPEVEPESCPIEQPATRLPEAWLRDLSDAGDKFKLKKINLTIGRDEQNDICIKQSTVSKHHASIEYKNIAFYIMDLRSTNGTRVNGQQLNPHESVRLKNGDQVSFGRFQFQLDIPEQIQFNDTVLLSRTSLNDPEDQATIMIDLEETNSQDALVACLQHHLLQIEALGPKFKTFIKAQFSYDTIKALAAEAEQNLNKSNGDQQLHFTSQVVNNIFYLICGLPVATHGAAEWYGNAHGGFTQFVSQWLKSDAYQAANCDLLCIATFGQLPTHWVSLTIVPTHSEPDPVEIISVDFLNADEKSALALNSDQDGQAP